MPHATMFVALIFLAFLRLQFFISASNPNYLFSSRSTGFSYQNNLPDLLGNLTTHASKTGFYNITSGETPNQLYGLYLCRGDIDGQACSDCVNYASQEIIKKCLYDTKASFRYDHCMIRFSDQPFFGKFDEHSWTSSWNNNKNNSTLNNIRFAEILGDTMKSLAIQVVNDKLGKKFATKIVRLNSFESLYAMGQCTWDLTAFDCNRCLSMAIGRFPLQSGITSANAYYESCMVSYEILPFFKTLVPLKSEQSFII